MQTHKRSIIILVVVGISLLPCIFIDRKPTSARFVQNITRSEHIEPDYKLESTSDLDAEHILRITISNTSQESIYLNSGSLPWNNLSLISVVFLDEKNKEIDIGRELFIADPINAIVNLKKNKAISGTIDLKLLFPDIVKQNHAYSVKVSFDLIIINATGSIIVLDLSTSSKSAQ